MKCAGVRLITDRRTLPGLELLPIEAVFKVFSLLNAAKLSRLREVNTEWQLIFEEYATLMWRARCDALVYFLCDAEQC